ncbi:LysR family transcriptional regulator [Phyllobacterium sp. 0TCS1.6C]|uniref:LysR family transcriptional regulator n=1 Tax=unclassified Phyllobacterium TaxID=2638441 RepID=UPI002264B824|nr:MULTISPECIES: LysR family transcriptional regulator [unclassified Phyllobacterium]MCX8281607.1 LysR family transcriptional regulator [Phyllobacterium sp. 0TCS1.6C]MCX8294717.1 LysR family transcriptional regulator [Phyllobacterium sp. 0TCS1.6A]
MDRLGSMAVFVKSAETGSFAAAAEAFGISAPMVGKHIRFLEDRLGVRLINRTTRRQSLTDFGRAYYERCRIVLAEAEAADALVAEQLSRPRGRLRVTMPALLGRKCVAPVLTALAQQHADLELDLSFADTVLDLAEGGFDLAVRTGTLTDRAGLIARRLGSHRMVVCASPAYVETHGAPRDRDDLARNGAVLYARPGWVHPWLFPQKDQPPFEVSPPCRMRLDDLEAVMDAAIAGMGMAWLPSWLVRQELGAGRLVRLLPDVPEYVFENYALWLRTPHMPLKLRLAIDALVAGLPKYMG